MPELDGLRGVGMLAVLAFHHGFSWVPGAPLAVSAFFTLSGFLIASLVLVEWRDTGRVSLAGFWERRARRLLPAALVTLAGIAVLQAAFEVGAGSASKFRLDLLSALGYVTNWRLIAGDGDYAAFFTAPSPVTHLWSVAIEEQFYLAFPLAFVALTARRRRSRSGASGENSQNGHNGHDGRSDPDGPSGWARRRLHRGLAVFAAATVVSFALAAVTAARDGNSGLAYYGTHTRAGEILAGVTLAYALVLPGVQRWLAGPGATTAIRAAALAGLVVMGWLWHTISLDDPQLFRGITALNALCTCAILVAATTRGGPTRWLLSARPLTAIGKISYATYLFHWPIYLALDGSRVPVGYRTLFVVRVAATLAAAAVSYRLLERPVRQGLVARTRPRLGLTVASGALAVTVLAVGLPVRTSDDTLLLASGAVGSDEDRFRLRQHDVVDVQPDRVVATVLQAGDSVSWSLVPGMAGWNDAHPDQQVRVDTHIAFGCPLSGRGQWRGPSGLLRTYPDCDSWLSDLPAAIERSAPSVVVMVSGLADVGGRVVDGRWREPGDPVFDQWFARRVDRVADVLAGTGTPVVWLTYPYVRMPDPADPSRSPDDIPLNEPARVEALNAAVRQAVAGRPGFTLVDLNAWVASWPDQFDRDIRDGVHFMFEGSNRVAEWLVPQLLRVAAA